MYESAKNQPKTFFIGIDADKSSLVEYSRKIYRKPERGGLPNVLYVISSAENLPTELDTTADTIWVVLPWGILLQKLILGEKSVLKNIVRISRLKGILKMFISYDLKYEPAEMEKLGLPELTINYVDEELAPLYESEQIMITKREFVDNEAMKEVSSTWAKRLAFGRNRRTLFITAEIDKREMLL